jgi:hypothetical protein
MMRLTVVLALGLLSLTACEKKEAPASTPAPSEAAATPTPAAPAASIAAAAATEPVVDVNSLPVEEQYEADAEQEITAENLTAKLDELEKEIATP